MYAEINSIFLSLLILKFQIGSSKWKYFHLGVSWLSFFFKKKYLIIYLFIWLLWVLVAAGGLLSCGMQTLSCGMHVGSSSPARDQTLAPCSGSTKS